MKSRIFLKLFAASLVLIAACMLTMNVLIQRAWEGMVQSEVENSLRQKTLLFASRVANSPREAIPEITKQAAHDANERATVIDSSGKVLADSEGDAATMDNHAERPEAPPRCVERWALRSGSRDRLGPTSSIRPRPFREER